MSPKGGQTKNRHIKTQIGLYMRESFRDKIYKIK